MTDVTVIAPDFATMWQLIPNSDAAREWMDERVEQPDWMPVREDGARVGDWRPMREIAYAMAAEGFTVANQDGAPLRTR